MPTGVATTSIIREDLGEPSGAEALKVDPKGPGIGRRQYRLAPASPYRRGLLKRVCTKPGADRSRSVAYLAPAAVA